MDGRNETAVEGEYIDEMIEIEYLLATMDKDQKPTQKSGKEASVTIDVSQNVQKKQNTEEEKRKERKKMASLLVALGIEAEMPAEFYERLLKSNRAKSLFRTIVDDQDSKTLINEMYRY